MVTQEIVPYIDKFVKGVSKINFQISAEQAQNFSNEILFADIKKFIADRPKEYNLFLEEQATLTSDAENKFKKKGA